MRLHSRLASCAAALLAVSAACGRGDAPADDPSIAVERGPSGFYGTEMPEPRREPTLRLVEHGGRPFDLAAERGRVVLLFMGYTNCPDVCPTTLADWRRVKAALGADTARVRFVFVTSDPERDTPEVAQRYARRFDPSFVGLSPTREELSALERTFMVTSYREAVPAGDSSGAAAGGARADGAHAGHGAYTVAHAPRTFVVDTDGRWRLLLPGAASAAVTIADVRRLLDE